MDDKTSPFEYRDGVGIEHLRNAGRATVKKGHLVRKLKKDGGAFVLWDRRFRQFRGATMEDIEPGDIGPIAIQGLYNVNKNQLLEWDTLYGLGIFYD